ncbi:MAG TPA: restriction endonuclease [Chthonomonadaceae bacterium]|nr:restriction endonuclease [Chthonomonadaceae bacterium]
MRYTRPATLPDPRLALASLTVLLLGLACFLGPFPASPAAGAILLLAGGGGLAWWSRAAWRIWRRRLETQAMMARRAVLQAARREREAQERARRQAQRAARAREAERRARERAERQQRERLQARQEAQGRAAQERRILADVARLRSLSDAQLAAEVAALFAGRGQLPAAADSETVSDLLLRTPDGTLEAVARCVPTGRTAGRVDVQALEAWRQAAGAHQGYLIALTGFSPSAVRSVRNLPITLVDAHLLAHWKS